MYSNLTLFPIWCTVTSVLAAFPFTSNIPVNHVSPPVSLSSRIALTISCVLANLSSAWLASFMSCASVLSGVVVSSFPPLFSQLIVCFSSASLVSRYSCELLTVPWYSPGVSRCSPYLSFASVASVVCGVSSLNCASTFLVSVSSPIGPSFVRKCAIWSSILSCLNVSIMSYTRMILLSG